MKYKKVFVTVGTTEFNELIAELFDEKVWSNLRNKIGCEELTIQYGRGTKPNKPIELMDISVESYDLKPSIRSDIESASLIIGHAGAGTCIEALNAGKALIVVTNDTLMNQHQTELAQQLHKDGFLVCTPLSGLCDTLCTFDALSTRLKKYENGNVDRFVEYLDDFMGFV